MSIESLQTARANKTKPESVYKGRDYSIKIIPMNYQIFIKLPRKAECHTGKVFYTNLEDGLEQAHKTAKMLIDTYFQK